MVRGTRHLRKLVSAPRRIHGKRKEKGKSQRLLEYIRRKASQGSEMHQYMLQSFQSYRVQVNRVTKTKTYIDPQTGERYNFSEAVRRARQAGILHYVNQRRRQAEAGLETALASGDINAVNRARAERDKWIIKKGTLAGRIMGHTLTRMQRGQEISIGRHVSRKPGEEPTPEGVTPFWEGSSKRIKSEVYSVLIFVLIGIFFYIGTPFFGLPSFPGLGAAFIFFIPAYILLPSQHTVLRSIEEGKTITGRGWILVPRSAMKLIAYILIIAQFFIYNRLISLAFAFIFYFTLKGHYKTSQPAKAIEAWAKMGFGVYLAYLFFLTFGGVGISGNNVAVSLGWMGAAFFITFPTQIEADADESKVTVIVGKYKKLTDRGAFRVFDAAFFLVTMFISLFFFGFNFDSMIHWTFYGLWVLSLLIGLSAGPGGRPAIGTLTILVALFAFSSTYPGVMGQAIFGYWWPQVQGFTEIIGDYIGPVWEQAQNSIGDAWLILTNPQQYYLDQMIKQTVTPSVITPGGTIKSIELTRFELTTSIPGILEPSEPTIGIMELNNEGDFSSGKINLSIGAFYVDPEFLTQDPRGNISRLFCSGNPTGSNSTSIGGPAYCEWTGKIYPKEARSITFKLEEGNAWEELFNNCTNNTNASSPRECICFTSDCPFGNTTYGYSGHSVKLKVNLTYDYIVNVSLPITIINDKLYLKKLQAGEIVLQDLTSEYTGGPVKATLFTAKQPARTDIPFLVTASIFNEGSGELLNITDFIITVYGAGAISNVEVIGETFRISDPLVSATPDGCTDASPDGNGNWNITCNNTWGTIEKGEFKRVSFYITPNSSAITDEKTTQIVAWANYEYKKTSSQTLIMANAPPQ